MEEDMEGEKGEKARNMRREIEADAWKKPKEREEEDFVTNRKWGNKLMEKGGLKGTLERETTLFK
ncbi:MAG: hypothetical protein LBD15_00075 [Holosporales bacterium]|nr:hypothetical protein [Holosporales bacterium]